MSTVLTGERRIVSVLIADVVNSTGIGERLGPERSKFLMDEVLRIMTAQIRRYDGTVVQRVGDEIFSVFGAPVAHEDDSERAVRAALAIQRAIAGYADEVRDAYDVDLAVRVGVNTGSCRHLGAGRGGDISRAVERARRHGQRGVAPPGARYARPGRDRPRPPRAQVEGYFDLERLGESELRGRAHPSRPTAWRASGRPSPPVHSGRSSAATSSSPSSSGRWTGCARAAG